MKCALRFPTDFTRYKADALVLNFDNSINVDVIQDIKGKSFFAQYAAWNFVGYVWWADNIEHWCIEIWAHHKYVASYMDESLQNLVNEIRSIYGTE